MTFLPNLGPIQTLSTSNRCIYEIVGITSYGNQDCGAINSYGVYTKVSEYLDWMEDKVWN